MSEATQDYLQFKESIIKDFETIKAEQNNLRCDVNNKVSQSDLNYLNLMSALEDLKKEVNGRLRILETSHSLSKEVKSPTLPTSRSYSTPTTKPKIDEYISMSQEVEDLKRKFETFEATKVTQDDLQKLEGRMEEHFMPVNAYNELATIKAELQNKEDKKSSVVSPRVETKFDMSEVNQCIQATEKVMKKKYRQSFTLTTLAIGNVETQLMSLRKVVRQFEEVNKKSIAFSEQFMKSLPLLWKNIYRNNLGLCERPSFYQEMSEWTGLDGVDVLATYFGDRSGIPHSFIDMLKGKKNIMFIIKTTEKEVFGSFNSETILETKNKAKESKIGVGFDEKHFIFTLSPTKTLAKRFKTTGGTETLELFDLKSENVFSVGNAFIIKKTGDIVYSLGITQFFDGINDETFYKQNERKVESISIVSWF
ncbi:hypothetical protein EIN_249100 [Entamoeba invadens IP1]|uniref:Uncharacterized protein n=1 Tax=Entamoeba invadens IP1 TaxID=370355 RepID=A0A0A1UE44_ENTIV|nr:hypothetical protein EIN_249100 [Entamoeba invadens IP1]ELP94876.1 hypothetical protein EIN_249100 [Entamoeba invadens IP1]|eukprot:XP_004261647.1 hypothetical protein EIN_249100 [Entamoeba invadens IP1]